jgi:hypothetical protein
MLFFRWELFSWGEGAGRSQQHSWSRKCATSRKVADSILDVVFEIFYCLNSSGRSGPGVDSASNRNEYQGSSLESKGDRRLGLATLPLLCTDCLEIVGVSTSWRPRGLSRPVKG